MDCENSIAIIGMAGKFPGARNLDEYWYNLENEIESITFLSENELYKAGVAHALLANPSYVKAASLLTDFDLFDAAFFDTSPSEAAMMDPEHRVFLEVCWEALEDAGYAGNIAGSRTAVFAGGGGNFTSYLLSEGKPRWELLRGYTASIEHIGNDKDFIATRVSYRLDLRGPAMNVQSGCSTALVAVHLACQSLLAGESDMALAGCANIRIPQITGYLYEEGSVFSPDGHCRAFDSQAAGTIFGSGVGCVLLKPLPKALEDNDSIAAVIRASTLCNDGDSKQSYWASSAEGIEQTMRTALEKSKISPETIGYIETHGTGTIIGDPVEVFAMNRAFRQYTDKKQFCAIGSVKTNIGHTETASGIASLLKAALALKHKKIPASLNFHSPNPHIRFEKSPFYVASKTLPFEPHTNAPLRVGINSLGIGGTNAHLIVEEAPSPALQQPMKPEMPQILTVSAKSPHAFTNLLKSYKQSLTELPEDKLANFCRSVNAGKKHFSYRKAFLFSNKEDSIDLINPEEVPLQNETKPLSLAFLFLHTDRQRSSLNYAERLYEYEPFFRQSLDILLTKAQKVTGKEVSLPWNTKQESKNNLQESLLLDTLLQIACFELWTSIGLRAKAIIAVSYGKLAASYCAGLCTLDTVLELAVSNQNPETKHFASDPAKKRNPTFIALEELDTETLDTSNCQIFLNCSRTQVSKESLVKYENSFFKVFADDSNPYSQFIYCLQSLYELGVEIDWFAYYQRFPTPTMKVPSYPFERKRHWIVSQEPTLPSPAVSQKRQIIFCYSGQGSLWSGMAQPFLKNPESQGFIHSCEKEFQNYIPELSLVSELEASHLTSDLKVIPILQFVMQTLISKQWFAQNIQPDGIVGHSLGEVSAAFNASILSLADAAKIIFHRTRLLLQVTGKMAVIGLPAIAVDKKIKSLGLQVYISGVSSKTNTTISGSTESIDLALEKFSHEDIFCREIKVKQPGHSPLLDPILPELQQSLQGISPNAEKIPIYSTVTAKREAGHVFTTEYWMQNLREPVQFYPTIQKLNENTIYIEISPHAVLLPSIQIDLPEVPTFPSMTRDNPQVFYDSLEQVKQVLAPEHTSKETTVPGKHPRRRASDKKGPFEGFSLETAHGGTHIREVELSLDLLPWVTDHRVQDRVILPGTAYLEMAFTAWQDTFGDINIHRPLVLKDVHFHKGIFFDTKKFEKKRVQFSIKEKENLLHFLLYSRSPGDVEWVKYCSATVQIVPPKPSENWNLENIQKRLLTQHESNAFYQAYQEAGVTWGPNFQSTFPFFRVEGEALRKVSIQTDNKFFVHPAMLDACIQSMNAADLAISGFEVPGAFVFHSVAEWRLYDRPKGDLWCYARRNQQSSKGNIRSFDFVAFREDGSICIEAFGLAIQYIEMDSGIRNDWLYEIAWEQIPLDSLQHKAIKNDIWFLFTDSLGIGQQFHKNFSSQVQVVYIQPGTAWQKIDDAEFIVDVNDSTQIKTLLEQGNLTNKNINIAILGGLDSPTTSDLNSQNIGDWSIHFISSLVNLLHVLPEKNSAKLYFASMGAQAIKNAHLQILQTSVWGLLRTFAEEYSELWGGVIDLDPMQSLEANARALYKWWVETNSYETQVILRQGHYYAARLSTSVPNTISHTLQIRRDGSFLISGGLGDLGLVAALRLAERGARKIALWGRTPLQDKKTDSEKLGIIHRIQNTGAEVKFFYGDISEEKFVRQTIGEIQNWAPLGGVIHAAGINNPAILTDWTPKAIRLELQAKTIGSWLLHQHCGDVDFFVMYSSGASILGSPLLGVYAAANAFLDGLAHLRKAEGKHALSINWGYWGEIGMAMRSNDYREGPIQSHGMLPMSPQECLDYLELLLLADVTQNCVFSMDWQEWQKYHNETASHPFFSRIIQKKEPVKENTTFTDSLLDIRGEIRLDVLQVYITETVCSVLKILPDDLKANQRLDLLGMDSMMSLSFKRKIHNDLSINIPIAIFLQDLSIDSVMTNIVQAISTERNKKPDWNAKIFLSSPLEKNEVKEEKQDEIKTKVTAKRSISQAIIAANEVQTFTFPSTGGITIFGHLSLPTGEGSHPVVVVHTSHYGGALDSNGSYAHLHEHDALTKLGFAVFTVDQRGAFGHGMDYMNLFDLGGGDVDDINSAASFVCSLEQIDANRVFFMGTSRGAYAGLLALSRSPESWHGAFLNMGFYDPMLQVRDEQEGRATESGILLLLQDAGKDPGSFFFEPQRNPMLNLHRVVTTPLLFLHGKNDSMVSYEHSRFMVDAAKNIGLEASLISVDGMDHDIEFQHSDWPEIWKKVAEFFYQSMFSSETEVK